MSDLTRWDRLLLHLPKRYWDWRIKRLMRWAKRNNVPPAPSLEELLPDLFPGKDET